MSHHPIHKHMHTFITKKNVNAAVRDDKAHMTYLKEDVDKDQKYGGKFKDINQTADEKHISKLAGDVKHDEKKEHVSRRSSSPLNQEEIMDPVGQDIDTRSGEWGDKDYELTPKDTRSGEPIVSTESMTEAAQEQLSEMPIPNIEKGVAKGDWQTKVNTKRKAGIGYETHYKTDKDGNTIPGIMFDDGEWLADNN